MATEVGHHQSRDAGLSMLTSKGLLLPARSMPDAVTVVADGHGLVTPVFLWGWSPVCLWGRGVGVRVTAVRVRFHESTMMGTNDEGEHHTAHVVIVRVAKKIQIGRQ